MRVLEAIGALMVSGLIGIGVYRMLLFFEKRTQPPNESQPKRKKKK